jgi:alpha-ketoglutarate-dependent taurine dioxygenase
MLVDQSAMGGFAGSCARRLSMLTAIPDRPPVEDLDAETPAAALDELRCQGWTLLNATADRDVDRFLDRVGTRMRQSDGSMRYPITFDPRFVGMKYSQSNSEVSPHTDGPGLDPPPRFVVLQCHRQARCGGGHTLLADGRQLLASLPLDHRQVVLERIIKFRVSSAPGEPSYDEVERPILERGTAGAILRYSTNVILHGEANVGPSGPNSAVLQDGLRELASIVSHWFSDNCVHVAIPEGALLAWDNHRMLHARTEYRDLARHLSRYWLSDRVSDGSSEL